MKKRILIIGGLGFIGKNLYNSLVVSGHDVSVVAPRIDEVDSFVTQEVRKHIAIGSILDVSFIEQQVVGYDAIFSLAGISGVADSLKSPYHDLNTNLPGHLNILEACRKFNPKTLLIFPSTRLVYGKPNYIPVDEKHPINPESIYAIHKHTVENYYLLYQRLYQLNCIILRISNPYGPHQTVGSHHGILNLLIHQALKDRTISVFGDGEQERDFLFADDLSALLKQVMDTPACIGRTFNVGYGAGISIRETAEIIATQIPGSKINFPPWPEMERKVETGSYVSDISLIQSLTGWKPKVDFVEGIRKTIQYERSK
jgi:UDP-glucose 4-epimerase